MSKDLKEQIAEMQTEAAEAVAKVKCQYLQLAAAIMRECDKHGMAGDIDQVWYALAAKTQDNRKQAKAALTYKEHCPQCGREWVCSPIAPPTICYNCGYEKPPTRANLDLARSVTNGVKHDAELMRRELSRVRIDECKYLKHSIAGTFRISRAMDAIDRRIRELEAEEE